MVYRMAHFARCECQSPNARSGIECESFYLQDLDKKLCAMTQHVAVDDASSTCDPHTPDTKSCNPGLGPEFGAFASRTCPSPDAFLNRSLGVEPVYIPAVSMGSRRNRPEGLHYN